MERYNKIKQISFLIKSLGLASIISATTVWGASQTTNFSVMCTQPNVNGGSPFSVDVQSIVTVPDNLVQGQTVTPTVSLQLTMPLIVAQTINGFGFDQIEGNVTAIGTVNAPSTTDTLTSTALPLPQTAVPNPAAPFILSTYGTWPNYTLNEVGGYSIVVDGPFVTVDSVIVSNSQNSNSFNLSAFSCSSATPVTVLNQVNVAAPTALNPPANVPVFSPLAFLMLGGLMAGLGVRLHKKRKTL